MVYFITMQEMPNSPCSDTPNVLFYPDNGKLYFAVEYTLYPSSKGLKYKIFVMHVDRNGNAHPQTPLYGMNAYNPTVFSKDTVKKVASTIQMIIAITCKRWYKYYEHSPAGIEYAEVSRVGALFENYLRFVPVNIQALEDIFFQKYGSYPSDFALKTGSSFPNHATFTISSSDVEVVEVKSQLNSCCAPGPSPGSYFVPPPPIPSDQYSWESFNPMPVTPVETKEAKLASQLAAQVTQPQAKAQRVLQSTPTTTLYSRLESWDPIDLFSAKLITSLPEAECEFNEESLGGMFDDL